ncbi:alpha/beta fold hydrolase [Sphingomonas sp. PAMC 26617]|uniref:alpha/beta fold hydrolase n=1 Tax=Sphingomonas sp. PAMC 26617 TaxID=1112216 RepID=UPI0018DED14D|nr:alpha/beta hydrolase [Sphingomonas sp. PAMC 26617]
MSGKPSVVRVNGTYLKMIEAGKGGPTLVFLHYWGGSSRTWSAVVADLAAYHRCVSLDFRGWGRSDKQAGAYELETLANDVIGVIGELGLGNYVIIGHSMGGKVAQIVAATAPNGLRRLILVAPAPPTSLGVPEEQRAGMLASYQSWEGAEKVVGILSALPLNDAQRQQVIEDMLCGYRAAKREWPERGIMADIADNARRIAVLVHVIVGDANRIEPEQALRSAFGDVVPNTGFTVLPGRGAPRSA